MRKVIFENPCFWVGVTLEGNTIHLFTHYVKKGYNYESEKLKIADDLKTGTKNGVTHIGRNNLAGNTTMPYIDLIVELALAAQKINTAIIILQGIHTELQTLSNEVDISGIEREVQLILKGEK